MAREENGNNTNILAVMLAPDVLARMFDVSRKSYAAQKILEARIGAKGGKNWVVLEQQ